MKSTAATVIAIALALSSASINAQVPYGDVDTSAGTGTAGFSGDGGDARLANLNRPEGQDVDAAGNVYVADRQNNRIRRISLTSGVITTVAGNGTLGYAGDGGPATSASLNGPRDVAIDVNGNIYIADRGNNRIRRVSALDGTISTVAGNGVRGFGGDLGLATSASLNRPFGVGVAADGTIYIADTENFRVRAVAPNGIILTVAGNGVEGFFGDGGPATSANTLGPFRVEAAGAGEFYFSDGNRIRRVADGIINTVAGIGVEALSGDGGPATAAALASPTDMTLDSAGNLYITDTFNHRVRRVSAATGRISTIAGSTVGFSGDGGPSAMAQFASPLAISFSNPGTAETYGILNVTDHGNERLRTVALRTPVQAVRVLLDITGSIVDFGTAQSVRAPLRKIESILEDANTRNDTAACGKLDDFVDTALAKADAGKLTASFVANLIARAELARELLVVDGICGP